MLCDACFREQHIQNPLHWAEKWNGRYFERMGYCALSGEPDRSTFESAEATSLDEVEEPSWRKESAWPELHDDFILHLGRGGA